MLQIERHLGNTVIKVSGDSVIDVFKQFAQAEDVFGHSQCGLCQSTQLKLQVRKLKLEAPSREVEVYNIRCQECGAILPLGVYADGSGLFARPYIEDEKGNRDYSTKGWRKYQPATDAQVVAEEPEEPEPFLEPEPEPEPVKTEKADLLVGTVMGVEKTAGEQPYPWEIEFLPEGKHHGEELFLPFFETALPPFVKRGAKVKLALVRGKSGRYIKKFFATMI